MNDADSRRPDPSKQLMFLQGSAGAGKTHTVRAMRTELRKRGIPYFISAITGIAPVQYPGGQTVHSLFSLEIDENQCLLFISHIGRKNQKAEKLLGTRLMAIDDVSMLTPWVAGRISLALGWIAGGNQPVWDFRGKKILFVGDFVQLPPVVQNRWIPVVGRLTKRLSCWPQIYIHAKDCITIEEHGMGRFLTPIAKGS
jgi:hypothetical protein